MIQRLKAFQNYRTRIAVLVLSSLTLFGCSDSTLRATATDCRILFDRLVELELREAGFNDPALTKIRQSEFASRFREHIDSCVGRPISRTALDCARTAKTSEALSHECFSR
ncbi:MAG: hypothetical protein R3A47_03490 [Polyangiales bacterium]